MMQDLKKINKKFHEFLKVGLNEETFDFDQIKIDEESLKEGKRFIVPREDLKAWIENYVERKTKR